MVRCLFNQPGIGNQINSVFHHCCLAWTLVEDDTEPIQQRQQLGSLLWLNMVQLQTNKLVFLKTLHRSINSHHSNRQHRISIPRYELTHEVSMNSTTRLSTVRGTNDIVNLTQPLLYNVGSAVFRLQGFSYKRQTQKDLVTYILRHLTRLSVIPDLGFVFHFILQVVNNFQRITNSIS